MQDFTQVGEMVYKVYQYIKLVSQQAGKATCNTGSSVPDVRNEWQLLMT
jgi:hypothetical protein